MGKMGMASSAQKHYQARIFERRDLSPDLWIMRIDPGGPFEFRAGQYATLGVELSLMLDSKSSVLTGAELERSTGIDSHDPEIRGKVPALENPGLIVLLRGRGHSHFSHGICSVSPRKIRNGVTSQLAARAVATRKRGRRRGRSWRRGGPGRLLRWRLPPVRAQRRQKATQGKSEWSGPG